jgi:hypothetical protein
MRPERADGGGIDKTEAEEEATGGVAAVKKCTPCLPSRKGCRKGCKMMDRCAVMGVGAAKGISVRGCRRRVDRSWVEGENEGLRDMSERGERRWGVDALRVW